MDRIAMAGHLIRRLHQQSTQVFQARTHARSGRLVEEHRHKRPGIDHYSPHRLYFASSRSLSRRRSA